MKMFKKQVSNKLTCCLIGCSSCVWITKPKGSTTMSVKTKEHDYQVPSLHNPFSRTQLDFPCLIFDSRMSDMHAFKIRQGLEHCRASLGTCIGIASTIIIAYYVKYIAYVNNWHLHRFHRFDYNLKHETAMSALAYLRNGPSTCIHTVKTRHWLTRECHLSCSLDSSRSRPWLASVLPWFWHSYVPCLHKVPAKHESSFKGSSF